MKRNVNFNKILVFLLMFLCSVTTFGQAQIKYTNLDIVKLPINIKFKGNINNAVRWADSLGDNIVITTETDVLQNKKVKHDADGLDAEIFAYHFLVKNDSAFQTWSVYDLIHDSPFLIKAVFLKNTFQVTDLDNNGIAEIWLMYKMCHGEDESPCDMKIIMHQGQKKNVMRGISKVFLGIDDKGNKQYFGGEYEFDKSFTDGAKVFIEFAKKMWNNNLIQTRENKCTNP